MARPHTFFDFVFNNQLREVGPAAPRSGYSGEYDMRTVIASFVYDQEQVTRFGSIGYYEKISTGKRFSWYKITRKGQDTNPAVLIGVPEEAGTLNLAPQFSPIAYLGYEPIAIIEP